MHDKESFELKNLDTGSNHDSSLGAKVINNVTGEEVLCATNNGGSSLFHWMVVLYEQGDWPPVHFNKIVHLLATLAYSSP